VFKGNTKMKTFFFLSFEINQHTKRRGECACAKRPESGGERTHWKCFEQAAKSFSTPSEGSELSFRVDSQFVVSRESSVYPKYTEFEKVLIISL